MNVFRIVRCSALLALALAVVALGSVVRAEPPTGGPVDGISCDRAEGAVFHIHQHLVILDRGKPIAIPDDIGRPLSAQCLYWIHTHSPDGLIHVESPRFRTFLLGEFFDIWGEPLSATAVGPARVKKGALRVYVDGDLAKGDPRKVELSQHTEITLETGPPYSKPTAFTDWQGQ